MWFHLHHLRMINEHDDIVAFGHAQLTRVSQQKVLFQTWVHKRKCEWFEIKSLPKMPRVTGETWCEPQEIFWVSAWSQDAKMIWRQMGSSLGPRLAQVAKMVGRNSSHHTHDSLVFPLVIVMFYKDNHCPTCYGSQYLCRATGNDTNP